MGEGGTHAEGVAKLLPQDATEGRTYPGASDETSHFNVSSHTWDMLKLRDYVSYVRERFNPSMSAAAQCLLVRPADASPVSSLDA